MAAGDSQRAWFPEMMAELKDIWNPKMSWEECAAICQRMTVLRESIWKLRNIKPARMWCPNCQEYHDSRPPEISIRSMLFALRKLNVIADNELKELDKSWKKYRKEYNLDAYGKPS
jgi:hypothetical protein